MRSGDLVILNSTQGVLVGMVIKLGGQVTHTCIYVGLNYILNKNLAISFCFPCFMGHLIQLWMQPSNIIHIILSVFQIMPVLPSEVDKYASGQTNIRSTPSDRTGVFLLRMPNLKFFKLDYY